MSTAHVLLCGNVGQLLCGHKFRLAQSSHTVGKVAGGPINGPLQEHAALLLKRLWHP
jgi:hypothetical protein